MFLSDLKSFLSCEELKGRFPRESFLWWKENDYFFQFLTWDKQNNPTKCFSHQREQKHLFDCIFFFFFSCKVKKQSWIFLPPHVFILFMFLILFSRMNIWQEGQFFILWCKRVLIHGNKKNIFSLFHLKKNVSPGIFFPPREKRFKEEKK